MRALLIGAALLCAACATTAVVPRQPFNDIPIPAEWRPYSRDSVIIQTPGVTAAKLVYFAEFPVDTTLDHARALLKTTGWTETKSARFVNPYKFAGVWADFTKAKDYCRVTVIEGVGGTTHVDLTVAKVNSQP